MGMAVYVENTDEGDDWRRASMQVIHHARDLQELAAARTSASYCCGRVSVEPTPADSALVAVLAGRVHSVGYPTESAARPDNN